MAIENGGNGYHSEDRGDYDSSYISNHIGSLPAALITDEDPDDSPTDTGRDIHVIDTQPTKLPQGVQINGIGVDEEIINAELTSSDFTPSYFESSSDIKAGLKKSLPDVNGRVVTVLELDDPIRDARADEIIEDLLSNTDLDTKGRSLVNMRTSPRGNKSYVATLHDNDTNETHVFIYDPDEVAGTERESDWVFEAYGLKGTVDKTTIVDGSVSYLGNGVRRISFKGETIGVIIGKGVMVDKKGKFPLDVNGNTAITKSDLKTTVIARTEPSHPTGSYIAGAIYFRSGVEAKEAKRIEMLEAQNRAKEKRANKEPGPSLKDRYNEAKAYPIIKGPIWVVKGLLWDAPIGLLKGLDWTRKKAFTERGEAHPTYRKFYRIAGYITAAALTLVLGTSAVEAYTEQDLLSQLNITNDTCVVRAPAANLREGAGTAYPAVGQVREGERLTIKPRIVEGKEDRGGVVEGNNRWYQLAGSESRMRDLRDTALVSAVVCGVTDPNRHTVAGHIWEKLVK